MSEISRLQEDVELIAGLDRRLEDLTVLNGLAVAEDDEASAAEVGAGVEALRRELDDLEVRTLLGGDTTSATRSCPSTRAQAAPRARIGRRCCCGCICAGPSGTASRPI